MRSISPDKWLIRSPLQTREVGLTSCLCVMKRGGLCQSYGPSSTSQHSGGFEVVGGFDGVSGIYMCNVGFLHVVIWSWLILMLIVGSRKQILGYWEGEGGQGGSKWVNDNSNKSDRE